ncbi:MAG: prephenate dehydrogenase/arogenate dehydrogenase family protein [Candidatus Nitrosopolaris sp.]|jgi:prephenate dehydrogenase
MIKKIAIVGAGGRMGRWFSRYFSVRKGIALILYDIHAFSLKYSANTTISTDIVSCVDKADLVILCVPILKMPHIIQECGTKMKPGAILVEISSIKNRSYNELKRVPNHVKPLCIHPMFGPAAPSVDLMKIILIPVRNEINELRIVKDLFRGADIRVVPDAETHDRFMSIILGLTYFTNLVFATFVSKQDYESLRQFAGTTFKIQSLLSTSILQDEPDLILALLSQNPSVRKQIRKYLVEAKKLERLFSGHNEFKMKLTLEKLKSLYQERENMELSYTQMYRIISYLNKGNSVLKTF